MKNKFSVNIVIDIITLIAMMLVSYSGLALQARRMSYSYLTLGFSRGFWHDIHIYAAVVFLFLLVVHVALHWSAVNAFFAKRIPNRLLRIVVYVVLLFVMLTTVVPAFFFI